MADIPGFTFHKNRSLLNQSASAGFDFSSGLIKPDVAAALVSETASFPARDIELAEVGLHANTLQPIEFARGGDKVSFAASGSAFAGLGIYRTGAAVIKKLGDGAPDFSLDALEFGADQQSILAVLRWGYAAEGTANGAMALSPVSSATLTVSGNREGLFAVIRRLKSATPARAVVQALADTWIVPRQISSIDQVEPGTWIVAEVLGGISVTLGAQLGYDFNWVREARLGGLTGDIGLRLQMGIEAAVGFAASGRCAVVVSRESDARRLRLRVFRLKSRELDLSIDASLSVEAKDAFLPDTIDDFISAVFDVHGQQILADLHVLGRWADPNSKLSDLLAQAGIAGADALIARLAGVTPAQLEQAFDAVHRTAISFIERWHALPHKVASVLLKLEDRAELAAVREVATTLSTITADGLTALLDTQLSGINFFNTPVGQFLESIADRGVLGLLQKPLADLRDIGQQVLGVLDGGTIEETLTKFQSFVETELHLDRIMQVATDADFSTLDALLKQRLASFLGQDTLVLQDLDKVRAAIRLLLAKREEYYEKALEALHRTYGFELNATYQATATDQALLDATFDFSQDPSSVLGFFQAAVRGELDDLLEHQPRQVEIGVGSITHGINRQTHVDVTLPFMDSFHVAHLNESLASVDAVPHSGGLLFTLKSSDTVASNQRKGILSLAMGLSKADPAAPGVRLHQDSVELNYTLLFARRDMQVKHVRTQVGPAVTAFFNTKIPDFTSFLDFLDRQAEEAIPNGPNLLGHGLISLQVSLSATSAMNAGLAWLSLPPDRKADVYVAMSNAIQFSLKQSIHAGVFTSPEAYSSAISTAQMVLAYCAIVPRAPKVTGRFDSPFWNWPDLDERRTMLGKPQTLATMQELLTKAHHVLQGDSAAASFTPERAARILGSIDVNSALLNSLLFSEAEMINHAFQAGLTIAASRSARTPSEGVKALAAFGSKLTEAFDANITTLLGPGIQAVGTRVFLDASRAIDPVRAGQIRETNAMLNIEFLKATGKFNAAALLAAGHVSADDLAFADRVVQLALQQ